MNFYLVPKYKKYNRTLNQVYFVSVPPTESPGPKSYDDLPVPIKINAYKQKNHRHVLIRRTASVLQPIKVRKDSYDDAEKGCGLSRWCARRRALKEVEAEHKKEEKRVKEWQNWKYKEAERVRQAEIERARRKREAEYIKQLAEIEQQKREFLKKTSRTRYPRATQRKPPPRESFKSNLSKEPYYPKRIKISSSNDNLVERSQKHLKKEQKKRERELKKQEREDKLYLQKQIKEEKRRAKKAIVTKKDPYPEIVQRSNFSKVRSCLNKVCRSNKKKEAKPYENVYKADYSKPETSKKVQKEIPYTDPYENYYEKPKKGAAYTDTYDKYSDKKDTPYSDPYEKYYEKSKKETPYTDPYEKYYDKPKKEPYYKDPYEKYYDKPKKEMSYTDPYQAYYDSNTTKRKKSVTDGELFDQYYKIYGEQSTSKKKKRKGSEPIGGKRKERSKYSKMFVNCFYRMCCECYCWFSVFLLIGVAIIMII